MNYYLVWRGIINDIVNVLSSLLVYFQGFSSAGNYSLWLWPLAISICSSRGYTAIVIVSIVYLFYVKGMKWKSIKIFDFKFSIFLGIICEIFSNIFAVALFVSLFVEDVFQQIWCNEYSLLFSHWIWFPFNTRQLLITCSFWSNAITQMNYLKICW